MFSSLAEVGVIISQLGEPGDEKLIQYLTAILEEHG